MALPPQLLPVRDLVFAATSERVEPDQSANMLVVQAVNNSADSVEQAIIAIKQRLKFNDPIAGVLALHLLDTCMRCCHYNFHYRVAQRILPRMVKIALKRAKYGSLAGVLNQRQQVKLKRSELCISLIAAWSEAFKNQQDRLPYFTAAYTTILRKGLAPGDSRNITPENYFTPPSAGGGGGGGGGAPAAVAPRQQHQPQNHNHYDEQEIPSEEPLSPQETINALGEALNLADDLMESGSPPDVLEEVIRSIKAHHTTLQGLISSGSLDDNFDLVLQLNDRAVATLDKLRHPRERQSTRERERDREGRRHDRGDRRRDSPEAVPVVSLLDIADEPLQVQHAAGREKSASELLGGPSSVNLDPLAGDLLGGGAPVDLLGGGAGPVSAPRESSMQQDLEELFANVSPPQLALPAPEPVVPMSMLSLDAGPVPAAAAAPPADNTFVPPSSSSPVGQAPVDAVILWLCAHESGVLYEDDYLQVGVKSEFAGANGQVSLFVGNKTEDTFADFACAVSPPAGLGLALSSEVESVIGGHLQTQVHFTSRCDAPFSSIPDLVISYSFQGQAVTLPMKLPVVVSKFMTPLSMMAPDYMAKWKAITAPGLEAQDVFQANGEVIVANVRELMTDGLHFAVLEGVDPIADNFVCAATLTTTSSSSVVLARLECRPSALMYRLTTRSLEPGLAQAVHDTIMMHLKEP